jgi:DUF1707 SHOCT-like domain
MTESHGNAGRPDDARGRVRASDADRDQTVERLRTHHEQGRLDATEFEERMSAALTARYCDELPPLLADLPPQESTHQQEMPPWARRAHGAGRPDWHRLQGIPLLPLLAVLVVVGSVVAVLHGHFPLPLLIGALLLWKFRGSPWPGRKAGEG